MLNVAAVGIFEVESDLELCLDSALAVLGRDARDFNLEAIRECFVCIQGRSQCCSQDSVRVCGHKFSPIVL